MLLHFYFVIAIQVHGDIIGETGKKACLSLALSVYLPLLFLPLLSFSCLRIAINSYYLLSVAIDTAQSPHSELMVLFHYS